METENTTPQPCKPRFQFGLSSLFVLTLLVACVLSAYRCLGPLYGLLSAVPLGIVATLLLCTRWRCTVGSVIGAGILAVIGVLFVINFDRSDPKFLKAMVTLGSFGGAFGASIHAIVLKRWILGSIMLVVSILVLLVILSVRIS
jgi:hypothetical protein